MVPVYEAFADPLYRKVILVCGAQMGKSEALLNIIGWNFTDRPRPCLYIGPTEKNTRSMSLDRAGKMIASTPILATRLLGGQRDKVTEKWIGGARLGFGWGSSATELASHPAAVVLVDERDRMPGDIDKEGDPVTLAEARTKNYRNSTVGVVSTPTIEAASPIWSLWEEGTRGMWSWRCDCGEWFIPRLELLEFDDEGTLAEIEAGARCACPHCGVLHDDDRKTEFNLAGRYLFHMRPGDAPMFPEKPVFEPPLSSTASFWISGLASPWVGFGEIARQLVAARRSFEPERVQGVVNTWGGELFRQVGDRPAWQEVESCAMDYEQGSAPREVQVVVAGVDVQRNKLYYVVRGFGHGLESWLLDYGEVYADTDHDDAWIRLGHLLSRLYGDHHITAMGVDSGYQPGSEYRRPESVIYSFARRYPGTVLPTKGYATLTKPVAVRDLEREGCRLCSFDTDHFKSALYARIRWPRDELGAWHVPKGISEDYCRQLVSEEVIHTPQGKRRWENYRRANHYFDCEVIAMVMARYLSLDVLPPLEQRIAAEQRQVTEQFAPPKPASPFTFFD